MKHMLIFILVASFFMPSSLNGQTTVPPVIPGDFADPSVVYDGKQYYAVGTSSEWAPHFPIYRSGDLMQWKQVGYVFDKAPGWTSGSFWAPEYYVINGQYYLYYTARRKQDGISCIGVAVSKFPDHGFVDKGIVVDYGKEAIDAFIIEVDGQRFMTFKAYGLDKRPIELLAMKLSTDGLSVEGEPFSLLKDDARAGLEGQSFIRKNGYYYLFYSAGNCCGSKCNYNVQVARSKSFKGPYERFPGNPILQENADWKCMGHGTFVQNKKGGYHYLFHGYNKESNVYTGRQGLLATLSWPEKNGWPVFEKAVGEQNAIAPKIQEDFKSNKPSLQWQWDWRNSSPSIQQSNGQLRLGGTISSDNATGIALTRRPAKAAFSVSTLLEEKSQGLHGLVYYGDVGSALGFGRSGNEIHVWEVRNKTFRRIQTVELTSVTPLTLKLSVDAAHACRFYYKAGNDDWKEVITREPLKADFLPQWDRSPRPGLHFKGTAGQFAAFKQFLLEYN